MVCRAANLLFEDFRRARLMQGTFLRGQRLADGADARVTNRATARLTPVLI